MTATHKYSALQYAVYLLSRRDYSERELRQKLILKAYDEQDIEHALAKVQAENWQSDARFCAAFIRSRAAQGYGPRRIKQDLGQKGVADWLVSQSLEECEIDWFEVAERVFEKKRPNEWDAKAKQKMWRYMASHGFYSDHFAHLMQLDFDDEYID